MKAEDKDLLLKDLCARFPYELKGKCEIDASYDTSFDTIYQLHKFDAILEGIKGDLLFVTPLIEDKDEQEFANEEVAEGIDILDFKPYLRPMLSMTTEELFEVQDIIGKGVEIRESFISILDSSISAFSYLELQAVFNYFNSRHLDYNGLIPMGLAMEAPEGMYNF